MKTILAQLGLEGLLNFDNFTLGWIETQEVSSFWKNLISEEEILKDLNFGVK